MRSTASWTTAESRRLDLAEARAELDTVEHRPPEYGRWLVIAALGLTAASLSRLFGGDWPTFAVTWMAGAAGTWLRLELGRRHVNPFAVPFAAAFLERHHRRWRGAVGRERNALRCAWSHQE